MVVKTIENNLIVCHPDALMITHRIINVSITCIHVYIKLYLC